MDEKEKECKCGENCECENCDCDENCECEECKCDTCTNEDECKCDEKIAPEVEVNDDDECEKEGYNCDHDHSDAAKKYLDMAQRVQAEFDNYRRRTVQDLASARQSGQVSVIETFLPCLDTFKEAKKHITDQSVLEGVEMIENKILSALESLGVEKIDAIGQKYDPHLHNAIAVMRDEGQENDIILDEYQAGYKFNDKVIRYSKVIVNKKED